MHFLLKVAACMGPLLFYIGTSLFAQLNVPKYQFGLSVGAFIYQGDLTPSSIGSYRTAKPGVNLFASRLFSPSFSVRANLAVGGLYGNDAKYDQPTYRQHRNFNFHTPVVELAGLAEWNVLGKNYATRGLAPYVFAGVGYGFLKIRRDWSNLDAAYFGAESDFMSNLSADAGHSLPKGLLVLPVGIGMRYYLNDKIGISAETSYRFASTDHLDGFSRAANPSKNDYYHSHSVGVVYRLGKKNMLDCPVVRY